MSQTLELERQGSITTVWMNRPDVFNAFNETMIAELSDVFAELDQDKSIRVVVLAGRGKHFSAGADLNWMQRAAAQSYDDNLEDARRLANMLRQIAELSKPTLARVHGAALGGGMGLVAACDMAVASVEASFATSEAKLGIIPGAISPYVLRAIGERQARRYFQSGERIDAARALSLGLVHEVVAAHELDSCIERLCQSLIACGPGAQQAAKQLITAVAGKPIDDALAQETAKRIARQRATAEAREGFAAFLAKRPPSW